MANSNGKTNHNAPSQDRPSAHSGTQASGFGVNSDSPVSLNAGGASQQSDLPSNTTGWRGNRSGNARVALEQAPRAHGTMHPGAAAVAVMSREDRVFPAPEQFREVSRTRKADPKMLREMFSNDTDTPIGGQHGSADPRGTMAANPRRPQARIAAPSVGKSTWDLRIQRKEIAGNVTGQVNLLPSDGSTASGLQIALLADEQTPEYEILSKLGAGSMGIVYHAKQFSLNRELAIKTLQPKADFSDEDQAMFVSEAVVTANLVHPNIVPIHDLGRTPDGKLFYSMKKVSGVAWQDTIWQQPLEENLDIFMKVCDAVAYAHSRGVINRDLKPENVVVGSYGEVVVLDWGIAITTELFEKRKSILQDFRGGAGTPVYMAPELADPDISRVGPHSDIYLLGAILFQALESYPPHWLKEFWGITDPYEQSEAVRTAIEQNLIEQDVTQSGELMQIARKAMSTRPEDRFSSVEALQEAIREYRITGRAEELLNSVDPSRNRGYTEYQGAVALYSEAVRKWPHNERALRGDRRARLAYAELAMRNGDIDLGLQILADQNDASFQPIIRKLKRTRLRNNLVRTTWGVTTVAALILIVALIGLNGTISDQKAAIADGRRELEDQVKNAEDAEKRAIQADKDEQAARAQKDAANIARLEAEKAEADALRDQGIAEKVALDKTNEAKQKGDEAIAAKMQKDAAVTAKEAAVTAKAEAEKAKAEADKAKDEAVERLADAEDERRKIEWDKYDIQTDTALALGEFQRVIELCDEGLQKAGENEVINKKVLEQRLKDAKLRLGTTANTSVPLLESPSVAAISDDGTTIAAYTRNGIEVRRIDNSAASDSSPRADTANPQMLHLEPGSSNNAGTGRLSVSPNGHHICLSTLDRLYFWTLRGTQFEKLEVSSQTNLAKAHFTKDSKRCVLVGTRKGLTTEIWEFTTATPKLLARQEMRTGLAPGAQIKDSALYPDESGLLIAIEANHIKECRITASSDGYSIQQYKDAENIATLKGSGKEGHVVDYEKKIFLSPDGSRLALKIAKTNRVLVIKAAKQKNGGITFAGPDQIVAVDTTELLSPKQIDEIVFSADNSRICTTHSADSVRLLLWDLQGDRYVPCTADRLTVIGKHEGAMLRGHTRGQKAREKRSVLPLIKAAAFLGGDSDRLVSVGTDPAIRFWKISTYGEYVRTMESLRDVFREQGPKDDSVRLERSPASDHSRRLAARAGRYVLTQQPSVSREEVEIKHGAPIYSVRFSTDGSRLVVGSSDSAARIYDSVTGGDVPEKSKRPRDAFFAPSQNNLGEGHISEITAIRFLPPNGDILLTSDSFGSISVWDAKSDADGIGHERARLLADYSFSEFAVSNDGKWILAGGAPRNENQTSSGAKDSELVHFGVVWKAEDVLKSFVPEPFLRLENEHNKRAITAVAISPSSARFATAGRRGKIVVWDDAGKKIASIDQQHGRDQVSGLAFIDDNRLLTTGYDGAVIYWQISGDTLKGIRLNAEESTQTGSPDFIVRLRLSPDGRQFSTSEVWEDKEGAKKDKKQRLIIRVWDLEESLHSAETPKEANKDEKKGLGSIASRVVFEKELKTADGSALHDVAWSSDSRELLITHNGDDDEVFRLLDASTWQAKLVRPLTTGYVRPVRAVLRPKMDGNDITVASFDGRLAQLWDLESGKSLAEFRSHASYRLAASFSSDRRLVVTASEVLRVFDADENSVSGETDTVFGRSIFRQQVDKNPWIPLADVACSPVPGDLRVAAIDFRGTVYDWKLSEEHKSIEKIGEFEKLEASELSSSDADLVKGNAVDWSPDGNMMACIQQGVCALRFPSDEGRQAVALPLEAELECVFNCITFASVNDKLIIAAGGIAASQGGSPDAYGALWLVENGVPKLIGTAIGQHSAERASDQAVRNQPTLRQAGITAIAIDAANEFLFTGGSEGKVVRWILPELADGDELNALQYSNDIRHLLLDKRDKTAHESSMVTSMDILPDGRLVTADSAGMIYLWPTAE